jgi:hypothetical protein
MEEQRPKYENFTISGFPLKFINELRKMGIPLEEVKISLINNPIGTVVPLSKIPERRFNLIKCIQ